MGINVKINYGMHRCNARRGTDHKRYPGKPHFRSFKNRTPKQVYDACKKYIEDNSPDYVFAERMANVLEVKIHLVTQAFAQLNREGILSMRHKRMDMDGCWTACAYSVRKVKNEVDKI